MTLSYYWQKILGSSDKYIDVPYDDCAIASEAAAAFPHRAKFVFGHEGAYIELLDTKKFNQNDPNNLFKELL